MGHRHHIPYKGCWCHTWISHSNARVRDRFCGGFHFLVYVQRRACPNLNLSGNSGAQVSIHGYCVHKQQHETTGLYRTIWTYFLVIFYSGTVRLICLFVLKLFIIYFRPGISTSHSHQRPNNDNFITTKAVAIQLNAYLAYNGLHVPLQSAYRSYHNTKSALMRVHNDIMISLDNGTV